MPRESAHAASRPFLFLIVCRAAPSEASDNFTQDRQLRAKNFCGTGDFYSGWSTGCQSGPKSETTASQAQDAVAWVAVGLRLTLSRRKLAVAQLASSQRAYSRR